jgi:hypothetical protein
VVGRAYQLAPRFLWECLNSPSGFSDPLIEPDVRFSRIRLSDWFHVKACRRDIRRQSPNRTRPSSS